MMLLNIMIFMVILMCLLDIEVNVMLLCMLGRYYGVGVLFVYFWYVKDVC